MYGCIYFAFHLSDVSNETHDNTTDCSIDDMASTSSSTPSSPSPDRNKPRSVIEGGTEVGWTPLSSVILWRRMLGIMGNVNHIKDPEIHATVFKHLIELWRMLAIVRIFSIIFSFFYFLLFVVSCFYCESFFFFFFFFFFFLFSVFF